MKTKWNEMTKVEKIYYSISIIFGIVAIVFAVLDFCTDWQYASLGWNIAFGLYLGMEAKAAWNKNRKVAVLDLVLGILLIVVGLITQFL